MTINEFMFQFENLNYKASVIRAVFDFCYQDLDEQSGEEARFVLSALFNQIADLSKQMDELFQEAWDKLLA